MLAIVTSGRLEGMGQSLMAFFHGHGLCSTVTAQLRPVLSYLNLRSKRRGIVDKNKSYGGRAFYGALFRGFAGVAREPLEFKGNALQHNDGSTGFAGAILSRSLGK